METFDSHTAAAIDSNTMAHDENLDSSYNPVQRVLVTPEISPRHHRSSSHGEVSRFPPECRTKSIPRPAVDNIPMEDSIPVFDRGEIVLGSLVGKGDFNCMYELQAIQLHSSQNDLLANGDHDPESHNYRDHYGREKLLDRQSANAYQKNYAVKFLRPSLVRDTEQFCQGAIGLLFETNLLAAFSCKSSCHSMDNDDNDGDSDNTDSHCCHPPYYMKSRLKQCTNSQHHPNIVQLHGISSTDCTAAISSCVDNSRATSRGRGPFIIIDRCKDTLDRRMEVWRELYYNRYTKTQQQNLGNAFLLQKLQVALDVASALRHLHSFSICYRDVKPDNVGFDMYGITKLFDFGLCRELDPDLLCDAMSSSSLESNIQNTHDNSNDDSDDNVDDHSSQHEKQCFMNMYRMTGMVGSKCYMAPEVKRCEPYNLSVDVYSYGLLLWQILTLQVPHPTLSCSEHFLSLVIGGQTYQWDQSWTKVISHLIQECLHPRPQQRPSFVQIHHVLKQQIGRLRNVVLDDISIHSVTTTSGNDSTSPPQLRTFHSI